MKVSDYIAEFFMRKNIDHIFGYPGGMVTHLMDSFDKLDGKLTAHLMYHEQGVSFAACGYSQINLKPCVAYGTSGPGATNMITGICNAYFDSIPVIFITGQVNTYEGKNGFPIRQKGFQETDIISMVKDVTKYAVYVDKPEDIRFHLEKAYAISISGRPGPVLLDLPMNLQREEVDPKILSGFRNEAIVFDDKSFSAQIYDILDKSKRPCILAGNGINTSGMRDIFAKLVANLKIPVVTSMIARDVLSFDNEYNFGFIGAYGHRTANLIVSQCDTLLCLGSRIDGRQTGAIIDNFAPNATIIRVDVDKSEFERPIKQNEEQIYSDLQSLLPELVKNFSHKTFAHVNQISNWVTGCKKVRTTLEGVDTLFPNRVMEKISDCFPDDTVITTDVGQNQVWAAQSFKLKKSQRMIFSGGHGAMGYSLPAAVGAYWACKKKVLSLNGDGGFQMNIQELETIAREKLPITIAIFNNNSLGMIRHFQEMYFNSNYMQTKKEKGYTAPDFVKIGEAYGIKSISIDSIEQITPALFANDEPLLLDISIGMDTYVFPKLAYNKPADDQEPPLDEKLMATLKNIMKNINDD